MKRNLLILVAIFLVTLLIFDTKMAKRSKLTEPSKVFFGIDMSGYQGSNINWDSVKKSHHPIKFIILRGTRGDNRLDSAFLRNFSNAKANGYVVGFYHYCDPDEDFKEQAKNFLKISKILIKGDFIPILDVESLPEGVTRKDTFALDSFRTNIKWMLDTIQQVHGVKPILYTMLNFYQTYLNDSVFGSYPRWIAAYSKERRDEELVKTSKIHQFTDSVRVSGISGYVDGNDIRKEVFDSMLLKK